MKRHSKAILIALAMLVLLAGLALFSLKSYVESIDTRERITAALSRTLGTPVMISRVRFIFPSGVQLDGVTIPTANGNFLEGTTIAGRCVLGPLLQRRIEIGDLRVEKPKIVWRQGTDGKWSLPGREQPPPAEPAQPAPPKEKKSERFKVAVAGFEFVEGTVEFVDKEQRSVATLTDLRLDYRARTTEEGTGTLTIERVLWRSVPMEKLRSTVKYAGGELTLDPLETTLGGGTLAGSITAQPRIHGIPFTATLRLDDADLGRVMNETGWAPDQLTGQLAGQLEAHGTFRRMVKIEGEGRLTLTRGSIRGLEILASLGSDLGIPELADLRLEESAAAFHLGDEKVNVDKLALNSTSLKILATGPVRLSGRIDLNSQLVLTQPVIDRLPESVRVHLADSTIDFKVSGTMQKPRTDLMNRLFSGKKLTEQFIDVFNKLVNGKDKREDVKPQKDKKKKSPSSPSTPPPLPTTTDPTVTTVVPPADPVPSAKP